MGRHFRIGRWAALSAVALLAACKPSPDKPFEPYPREGNLVHASTPNCHRGYKAFRKYAESRSGEGAWTAYQPTFAEPSRPTRWAKVSVVQVEGEQSVYTFTQPGHPAHPALVIKSIALTSEGASWMVAGCGWGDRRAYHAMQEASRRQAAAFEEAVTAHSAPPDELYVPGQDPEDERIRAPKDKLVSAVADRAYKLHMSGRELETQYSFTPEDRYLSAASFTWLETPAPLDDRLRILDQAIVSLSTKAGTEAVVGWCAGPDGARTPRFCAKARENNGWSDDWAQAERALGSRRQRG